MVLIGCASHYLVVPCFQCTCTCNSALHRQALFTDFKEMLYVML